jgi:hypothetical protein
MPTAIWKAAEKGATLGATQMRRILIATGLVAIIAGVLGKGSTLPM